MHVDPANYVIAKFGGARHLARALDIDYAYVYRWKKIGLLPAKHQARIYKIAIEKGLDIDCCHIVIGAEMGRSWVKQFTPTLLKP